MTRQLKYKFENNSCSIGSIEKWGIQCVQVRWLTYYGFIYLKCPLNFPHDYWIIYKIIDDLERILIKHGSNDNLIKYRQNKRMDDSLPRISTSKLSGFYFRL